MAEDYQKVSAEARHFLSQFRSLTTFAQSIAELSEVEGHIKGLKEAEAKARTDTTVAQTEAQKAQQALDEVKVAQKDYEKRLQENVRTAEKKAAEIEAAAADRAKQIVAEAEKEAAAIAEEAEAKRTAAAAEQKKAKADLAAIQRETSTVASELAELKRKFA